MKIFHKPSRTKEQEMNVFCRRAAPLVSTLFCCACSPDPSPSGAIPPSSVTSPPAEPDQKAQYGRDIQQFKEVISAEQEKKRLGQANRAADYVPTCFYWPSDTPLTLRVTQLEGKGLPRLMVGTPDRYVEKAPILIPLKLGTNILSLKPGSQTAEQAKRLGNWVRGDATNATEGLLYIDYSTEDPHPSSRVSIEFVSGHQPVPCYVLGRTKHADWRKEIEQEQQVPDVQLVGRRTIMVVSKEKALAHLVDQSPADILQRADQAIDAMDDFSGLDGETHRDQKNIHKIMMTESNLQEESVAARAMDYATSYNASMGVVDCMLNASCMEGKEEKIHIEGKGEVSCDCAAVWHEIGHVYTQDWVWRAAREAITWIYAQAVQRHFKVPMILEKDNDLWNRVEPFTRNGNRHAIIRREIGEYHKYDFIRSIIFHQLWLAPEGGDDFYRQLHKRTRKRHKEANEPSKKAGMIQQEQDSLYKQRDLLYKKRPQLDEQWDLLYEQRRHLHEQKRHPSQFDEQERQLSEQIDQLQKNIDQLNEKINELQKNIDQLHQQGDNLKKNLFPQDGEGVRRRFMLDSCLIMGKDLSRFFQDWGLLGDTENVEDEGRKLRLPPPERELTSLGIPSPLDTGQ